MIETRVTKEWLAWQVHAIRGRANAIRLTFGDPGSWQEVHHKSQEPARVATDLCIHEWWSRLDMQTVVDALEAMNRAGAFDHPEPWEDPYLGVVSIKVSQ